MITLLIIVFALLACLFFLGTLVQILAAVVLGLIAGSIARWIVPGTQYMPWWQTALLGIAGSVAAGIIGAVLGVGNLGILGSIIGAVGLLFLVGRLRTSGLIALAIAATLAGSGCANRPDPTPHVAETRAMAKVVGTPIVFVAGVFTWPVGIAMACSDTHNELGLRTLGIGWPFYMVIIYWDDSL